MSTKRPSIVVNSDIIQKYVGSDFDAIAFLDSRISTLENTFENLEDDPSFVTQVTEVAITQVEAVGENLFVAKPLLDYPVDFSGDGYSASTLGALLSAYAIDLQQTQTVDRGTLTVTNTLGSDVTDPNILTNLTNDAALNDISQAPDGITTFYNPGTNSFDFSQFSVGDLVTLRVDIDIVTGGTDQEVDLWLSLAEGTASAKSLKISRELFLGLPAAYGNITGEVTFNIANEDIRDNEGHVQLFSAAGTTTSVNTFEVFVTTKN
jgi:hypothetical protein